MPPANALAIAQDLSSLAGDAADALNDPDLTLSSKQVQDLTTYASRLTSLSNTLATGVALATLAATQSDLDTIKSATQTACAAVKARKSQMAHLNSVLTILGDAVSLGSTIASGTLVGVLSATASLASDSTAPKR